MATLQRAGYPPIYQPITLFASNGTNFTIRLHDIDEYQLSRLETASGYSAQIGMCAIVLFVLLITTKLERLKTPVFIMNVLCLIVAVTNSTLRHLYWLSPWGSIYVGFTQDYSVIPKGDWILLKAATCSNVILMGLIEGALVLQCRSVFAPYQSTRNIMTMVSSVVAFVVMSIDLWVAIATYGVSGVRNIWVSRADHIAFAFSLCFFSSILMAKLWKSIVIRKKLGFKQFGPVSIIFIMACQTMLIPVVCTIIGMMLPGGGLLQSSRVIVVVNLPLSTIWATAQSHLNNDKAPSSFMTSLFHSHAQTDTSAYSDGNTQNIPCGSSSNPSEPRHAYIRDSNTMADYPTDKEDRFNNNSYRY